MLVGITLPFKQEDVGSSPTPSTMNTEMICLYIVNEEPAYISMLSFSLRMLRQHNPNVPIVVYYVQDGRRDTRYMPLVEIARALNKLPNDFESLSRFCEELNVEIRVRVPKQEQKYSPLHRLILQEVEDKTVLLLDSDTFIFGNIENLPQIYSEYDFVATPNTFGLTNKVPAFDPKFKTFNSGVVLCQNGLFRRWMNTIGNYCDGLYYGGHPLSKWLWETSTGECDAREEFSASLFVLENNVKYAYFEDKHVQMGSYDGNALILHTLTPGWRTLFQKCFGMQRRAFRPRLSTISSPTDT